jgi:hypothetical protein
MSNSLRTDSLPAIAMSKRSESNGCPARIRTWIRRFRAACPTVRRPGKRLKTSSYFSKKTAQKPKMYQAFCIKSQG